MPPRDTHPGPRLLARWIGLVHRRAVTILVAAVVATVAAGYVTTARIGINTSTTDMLAEDLPFRRNAGALDEAFPQSSNILSVVVEARTPDQADDAARALAGALDARSDLFRSVFYAEADPFFRRNGLLYLDLDELQALSDRLAEAQPLLASLKEDLSLRGLSKVLRQALGAADAEGPDFSPEEVASAVEPVLDRMADTVASLAAAQAGQGTVRPLSWFALLSGEEPTASDKRRFVVVQPVLDYASLEPAARAIAFVRQAAQALGLSEANGVRVRLTGSPVMLQDELRSLQDSLGLVGLISLSLVVGLLAVGLRSARLVVATLVTLFMGLVWTAWFATVAIGELNLISVAFAVLFIGLSVDFGIHFVLRYKEAVDAGAGQGRARDPAGPLSEAARGVGGPLALCAVAAALGFFAFLPTAYRGLSELGLISGVGMFIALFANLTVLPALLSLLPARPGGAPLTEPLGEGLQRLVSRRPRPVLAGAAALALAALALGPFARFDDDPLNLRDPQSESVATLLDLLDDPRVQPYSAEILAPDLKTAEGLAARIERLAEVDEAVTLADYVPEAQDEKLTVIEEMSFFLTPVFQPGASAPPPSAAERRVAVRRLRAALAEVEGPLAPAAAGLGAALDRLAPTDAALARLEQALLSGLPARLEALGQALEAGPVRLEDLPGPLRERNVAADGRAKIEVTPAHDLRDAAARVRFVDAVRQVAPDAAGAPVTITEAGRAVVRAFAEAAAYAIVLITALLLVVLRDVRDSLTVLAPLILAALLTVGATVVFAVPFNFANVIVLPLLFGLGVAGGIHIVARARDAGAGALMATSTPRAVLLSALTTIGSFWALALSSHRGMSSMGVLLTIAISLTLVCTLVVLPALLSVAPPRGRPKSPDAS